MGVMAPLKSLGGCEGVDVVEIPPCLDWVVPGFCDRPPFSCARRLAAADLLSETDMLSCRI